MTGPMPGIVGAMTAFKAARDVAATMIAARDVAKFQELMLDFQSKIIDANDAAMDAQEERVKLMSEIDELKKELSKLKDWESERQRYHLMKADGGVFVYALRDEKPGEAFHLLCVHCFENGKKSILQMVNHAYGRAQALRCNVCKVDIYTKGFLHNEHVTPK